MVGFNNGAAQIIMDLDTFEYTYGDADGPDPAQRDLDSLLPKVTRVCVLEGAMLQGRAMGGPVLLETRDPRAIQELAGCLQIIEDPSTFSHCACLGGPTLELYAGPEHVATIGLQHGRAIRWKQWHHDAQLQAGNRLTRWLHDQGVDPARLEANYHRGNFGLAEPRALSGHQQEAQQLCAQARELAQEGNLAEALRLCTRALELDPDPAEAYALRGQVHYHSGHLPEAAADCSAAIDRGLRHAEVYFIRAIALDNDGRVEETMADCSMALHLNPEHAGACNSRGLIRGRLGRLDEALADFSEAIRLAPKWFLPYLHRAQLAHGRGQLDTARIDYDLAIELLKQASPGPATPEGNPTMALAYCRRGDAHYDQFHEAEADADFAEARRHHPAAAANYLGDMWLRRSNFDRALEEFAQLVQLRPRDTQGYLGRGLTQEARGDLEQADADYSTAIGLQPDEGSCYLLRARVRHRQGRTDDALTDLSEHLRLHPNDAMAYLFRASVHKERKAVAAALQDLNAAHRVAPDDPQVCNNLAWLLATCTDASVRDGPRAVVLARQACRATEWKHPFCLGTLGAALAETAAFDEAIRWQTEALALYPESEQAAGRERLKLYRECQPYRE
jgi:tetratricopeptide (TPR) repeat protein